MPIIKMKMPIEQEIYAFLKVHYRHARFEGRNGDSWGKDYSLCIVKSAYQGLEKHGYSLISNHESKSNETVYYLRTLETFSDMTSLREHVYAIPETVSIEITVPCDLTGNIERQELAQRLAHLRRKVHAMHPFCRVVVNAGEVETDVKITNATLAEDIELREDIAAKIEHWVYRLR